MRCFTHPEAEAVGICMSCGKGLCAECAEEYEGSLYCNSDLVQLKINVDSTREEIDRAGQSRRRRDKLRLASRVVMGLACVLLLGSLTADIVFDSTPTFGDTLFVISLLVLGTGFTIKALANRR